MSDAGLSALMATLPIIALISLLTFVWDCLKRRTRLPNNTSDYRAYQTSFDEEVDATHLAAEDVLIQARQRFDEDYEKHRTDIDGALGRRLVRLLADGPATFVTLLIDNSGSMRGRESSAEPLLCPSSSWIVAAACTAQLLCEAVEEAGQTIDVLGYTTVSWKGGPVRQAWVDAGSPANPGRLCALRHIVYKHAEDVGPAGRRNFGAMLIREVLKENVDGEALEWAADRLMRRPEARRILLVISDGAPVDDTTILANGVYFLPRHLTAVVRRIEMDDRVRLGAVGLGFDANQYYRQTALAETAAELPSVAIDQLITLLGTDRDIGARE